MKIQIEALHTVNQWYFSAAPELRIYALSDFHTDNGELVLRGTVGTDEPHLKIQCTLDGATLEIPSFEIDSTPLNPPARYTAIFVVGSRWVPFLSNFTVPSEPSSTTWDAIKIYQRIGRMRYINPPQAELQQMVAGMIANALTFLRFGSETQVGMVALDEDPLDPAFPTALSANSSRIARDSGTATMVNGAVTVLSAQVTPASKIKTFSLDDGVVGPLRAPLSEVVEGVSFVVRSSENLDSGVIGWEL